MRLRAALGALGLCAVFASACGGRSGLPPGREEEVLVACTSDADCQSVDRCLPKHCSMRALCEDSKPVICNDGNVCTQDSCVQESGRCSHVSLLADRDGDGVVGVQVGVAASIAAVCGTDCDDSSNTVRPGGPEFCDGKDNDCNGVVDDGAAFYPSGQALVRVSESEERAQASGIAFDGERFALGYAGKQANWKIYFQGLSQMGALTPKIPITSVNADTFGGPIIWTGTNYALAWEDARQDDNYEIYFSRVDRSGTKFAPDLRITSAPDFSLHPAILFAEGEYLIAWDDRRPDAGMGANAVVIYGQRVSESGELVGGNTALTLPESGSESPALARGKSSIGMVYSSLVGGAPILNFRWLSPDLGTLGPVVDVGFSDVRAPSILWVQDRYLIFWEQFRNEPGSSIWGAALAEDGTVLVAPRPVTDYGQFARSHAAVSLGDRALLVWSDFRYGNYELESKLLSTSLLPLTPDARLTNTPSDTLSPQVALGGNGGVGVLFEDWLSGTRQVYFTQLTCQSGVN